MRNYLTNPPWVDGGHDIYQSWLRRIVRRTLLRYSYRQLTYVDADDIIQEAILKVLQFDNRETEIGRSLIQYPGLGLQRQWILKLVRDFALFISALNIVRQALRLVPANVPKLMKLRDKVKSLNPPIKLIPQSLHPVRSLSPR